MAKKSGKRKTLRKKLVSKERAIVPASPARKKQATPEIIPNPKATKKSIGDLISITNPRELRNSISNIREWSAQMRGTMIQMEQTLDTLTNLIGMYERWQGSRKTGVLDKNGQSFSKLIKSIDFQQILNILNSPLLQALLEFNEAEDEEEEEKNN